MGLLWVAASCATTEFPNEGPGQPTDRASGAVPPGAIGVCKKFGTKKPPLVNQQLWDDARQCTGKTPPHFIRLGYSELGDSDDAAADQQAAKILGAIKESTKEQGGNDAFHQMMRQVRDSAAKNPELRSRVSRETARTTPCDFTYLFNTMTKERARLEPGKACSAEAYDQKQRDEVCLFDGSQEAAWVTSAWDCVASTNSLGSEQSCHRLCAYDDYCTRQVSCAAADIDLLLCVLGICTPEQRQGF